MLPECHCCLPAMVHDTNGQCHVARLWPAVPLIEELFTQESLWINLQRLSCFDTFLSAWGNRQQDAGEFLAAFLRWTQPLCVHLRWKRRVWVDQVVETADEGSRFTPPTICAPAHAKKISLQQLVDSWASYMGMSTAFVHSGKLVNLHLDRFRSVHSCLLYTSPSPRDA